MEGSGRSSRRKVSKRNNCDMKDKLKDNKMTPDGLKDGDEFNADPDCDQTTKNGEQKVGERFLEPKTELLPRPEDLKEEELLDTKIKTENLGDESLLLGGNPPVAGGAPPDLTSNVLGGVPPVPMQPPNQQQGVQPLPSNVINKQPGTLEAQYMQQQSQIFVFSTALANKAAEAVLQGHFQSIIAFHCAQPGTKKYLEKHPLKLNQFNRTPAQWLNNLPQFKQKTGGFGTNGPGAGGPPGGMPGPGPMPPIQGPMSGSMQGPMGPMGPNMSGGPPLPPHMQGGPGHVSMQGPMPGGHNHMQPNMGKNMNPMGPMGPRMMGPGGPMAELEGMADGPAREMHPDFPPINIWNQQGGMNPTNVPSCGPMGPPLDDGKPLGCRVGESPCGGPNPYPLTGTKVPTENLTPQQRAHREEQLATLRKMQQMLFPENQNTDEFRGGEAPVNGHIPPRPDGNGTLGSPMTNNSGGRLAINPGEVPEGTDPNSMQKLMGAAAGPNGPNNVAAQMEWHKLQQQFYEERKKNGNSPPPSGPAVASNVSIACSTGGPAGATTTSTAGIGKIQGPPPPYHQTGRSASVPIAAPSPTPGSPSNATSNMSLPSPRTTSELASPSDTIKSGVGNNGNGVTGPTSKTCSPPQGNSPACKLPLSNPDTPLSSSQSPTPQRKDASAGSIDFASKDMFSRGKVQIKPGGKEPNLMPVPSPQQIQYLNTFEGQELTIQKQPNTSLKDSTTTSPINHGSMGDTPTCKTPNANQSPSNNQQSGPDMSPRYQAIGNQPPNQQNGQPIQVGSGPLTPAKDGVVMTSSPEHSSPCRSDNVPLNPNSNGSMGPTNKSLHFDPISSLAQMSQQLTNQAPSNQCQFPQQSYPISEHMDSMDNLPFVPMDMSQNFMNNPSPKPPMGTPPRGCGAPFFPGPQFPRMMGPTAPGPYNGMNVQVKASTPNTIQYLPARPTGGPPTNIRNPPSLDFLPRFPTQENKPPQMFMPGCLDPPNVIMGPAGGLIRGQLRPPQNMKGPPQAGPGKPGFPPMVDPMGNPGMFMGGKGGMPPDATQPLPPSMSQGGNFKNSPFVGPTVADPNYAQQFHNFQQQLYATNTRSQMNSMNHMNQNYFMPK